MKNVDAATTTVIDAGARYGIHPSWSSFGGELLYFAFEPDKQEADHLRRRIHQQGFEVIDVALGKETGERDLYITKHRGYGSFLQPDAECEWFKRYRPGEGEIDTIAHHVGTSTVDEFASSRRADIDFLKVDTEGTELEVLQGADRQVAEHVLGIRTSVYFQACYKGQPLFSEVHNHLLERHYFLLNLDYLGRGVPRNSLFRNPDPLSVDHTRYGTLIGTDGVWLRDYRWVCERHGNDVDKLAFATLKYAHFCILNHAPDVGIDTLLTFVTEYNREWGPQVVGSRLYRSLRMRCAEFLGRWRVYPDAQWDLVRTMFRTIFGLDLEGGHKYWELLQSL